MPSFTCNPFGARAESFLVKFLELLGRNDGDFIIQLLSILVNGQSPLAVQ
jgi:hypothetical protein